ncbi:endonuclease/exonuclease/phosphatase family protein [Arthrobacter sp. NicSoilB8]|uniref:endonuclease/exonuclease/phosphatase family protein n=1 Tax=Arthrobacter sp. NicSoilB8 TaxID=2830998 RepID=UPI001CC4E359|nr:endonuclease/exonuclease/phosphatase family protein [Arthrobacter sp. NicSoilB8]BCW71685.1 endonuclease [Arthrobacter sp. NicSoilB8]
MKRRSPSRRWQVSSALCAAPVAVVSVFRAVPVPWPAPVVQLVAFTPWFVLPAGAALLLALPARRPWAALPAGALLALQLLWLFPPDRVADRFLAGQADPPQGEEQASGREHGTRQGTGQLPAAELKVMTLNAWKGQADAADVVRLVRENGVELLAVQELSPALERRLDAQGLGTLLPHRVSRAVDGAGGGGVYSSRPIAPLDSVDGSAFHMPTVRVDLGTGLNTDPGVEAGGDPGAGGGRPVSLTVTNVHTKAPVWGRSGQWRSELAALGRVAARPGNVLLLGDFNATLDHAEFRQMLAGGPGGNVPGGPLVDAGAAALARLVPTWPQAGPPLPGVVIDHVVTSPQVPTRGYAVVPVAGSDHAAVLATLTVPAGG